MPFDGESRTIFIEDMHVGLERLREKVVTRNDIALFGQISGDLNPLHFDDDYAASTMFGGVVAHGMLSAGLISAVIGEELPGHGAIYLSQTLAFRGPVRPGDLLRARCRVAEIIAPKRRIRLDCAVSVGDRVVLDGEALVLTPSRAAG